MSKQADPLHFAETSELLARWPEDRPLALLASHGDGEFGRFSLAATPTERIELRGPNSLEDLASHLQMTSTTSHELTGRGWMVVLGYELGARIEPAASGQGNPTVGSDWPEAILLRCDGALIRSEGNTWHPLGNPEHVPDLLPPRQLKCSAGKLHADFTREQYEEAVAEVVELIHAGDCFQANIAQRFHCRFTGSVRQLASAAFLASGPRYGALLETAPGRAIVSMSPELFLEVRMQDGKRVIRTRPIKGTLPATGDPNDLVNSEKDAAELAMIVDLMRNDLGRVCDPGSISVRNPRTIETHRTIHHAVGEVSGALRSDVGVLDILTATFPPGSVTGAPKIRAMQIIESLEPVRRGPYCGAIGWLDDSGLLVLNVAIRTITATGEAGETADWVDGRLDYFAGCGIVADSIPASEYDESIAKTAVFQQTLEGLLAKEESLIG